MLSIAGFLLWLEAVFVLSGAPAGVQETRLMLPPGPGEGPISLTELKQASWTTPWRWVVPFTAGTIAYLFGTAFLHRDHDERRPDGGGLGGGSDGATLAGEHGALGADGLGGVVGGAAPPSRELAGRRMLPKCRASS